jgi:hypothetical protein
MQEIRMTIEIIKRKRNHKAIKKTIECTVNNHINLNQE